MNGKKIIVRADDIGFCHAANMAVKQVLEQGLVTATSVIVNTPWLTEAAAILEDHPEVSVGVHLVLNSEWREYRWGPIMSRDKVHSLVDRFGRFFPSRKLLMQRRPVLDEVEAELRAQVQRALDMGLRLSYMDYHMGTAASTLEFQEILERLADFFQLAPCRYFGEQEIPTVYGLSPEEKKAGALRELKVPRQDGLYLWIFHPGLDFHEMAAMTDLNAFGLKNMSKHRQAEAGLLCDPDLRSAIAEAGFTLIGYDALKNDPAAVRKRPGDAPRYEDVIWEAIREK
ncbi:MAG TPA: ChbG/HpnK family deacetylase [Candidatus Sumerlaeota bacterium]|nr:ChbG/HpnK family deacetylase [Candidatus Sumerlaeota bacterium]